MPAYNAAETVERTYRDIPKEIVDEVILVDDCSQDATVEVAKKLGLTTIVHAENRGYGANQKTCYRAALEHGAQIIVMVHPDYQYDPHLILPLSSLLAEGLYDVVLGSRILGGDALRGGMPLWKYVSNRFLTFIQNLFLGSKLSEFHTGYRAFSREVLQSLPLDKNSNDFVFDNEVLAQIILKNYRVGEISCPAKYFPEASSINIKRSIIYGFGVLKVSLFGLLYRLGLFCSPIFQYSGHQTDAEKF